MFVFVCVCVPESSVLSLSLSLSFSLSPSLSLPPSLHLHLSLPLSLLPSLSLSPSLSLPPSLPLPLSLGLCELVAASEMLYTRARGVKSWDVCARELKWLRSHSKRRTEMPRIEVGKLCSQELGPTGRRCPGLQRALNAPDRTRVARAPARAPALARVRVCAGVRPYGGSPARLRVIAGPPRGPDPSAPPAGPPAPPARSPRPPPRPPRPASPARACPSFDSVSGNRLRVRGEAK